MNINLNLYKYFYEVAKCGNYTKASEKLLISQPSISYSIKTLEEQLDVKLFVRKNHKNELTSDGRKLFEKLDKAFQIISTIDSENDENLAGSITVGCRIAYATKVLNPAIFEFNKIYPDIEVNVLVRSKDEMEDSLENNKVDMLIDDTKYCEKNFNKNNIILETKTDPQSIIVAATKFKDEIDKLEDLTIYTTLTNRFCKDFYDNNENLNFKDCKNTQIMISNVSNNKALGHTATKLVENELNNGTFYIIDTKYDLPVISTYISYQKNNKLNGIFIDFLKNKYKSEIV